MYRISKGKIWIFLGLVAFVIISNFIFVQKNPTFDCESHDEKGFALLMEELAREQHVPNRAPPTTTKPGKAALIWAGTVKTALQHATQFRKHLLEPNDMDVYAYIDSDSAVLSRGGEKDPRAINETLIEAWGDRLRGLWFVEEDPGLPTLIHINEAINDQRVQAMRKYVHQAQKDKIKVWQDLVNSVEKREVKSPFRWWNWFIIDQFTRLERLVQLAEPMIMEGGYDRVFRFRADVELTEDISFSQFKLTPNTFYVVPNTPVTTTEVWLAEPKLALSISSNFVKRYLQYVPDLLYNKDLLPNDLAQMWVLAPEATLMNMLITNNQIEVKPLCHRYKYITSNLPEYGRPIETLTFFHDKDEPCRPFEYAKTLKDKYLTIRDGKFYRP